MRHFLTILDLSAVEAEAMLHRALDLKRNGLRLSTLAGKTLILLFEKASTRTRLSFEVAVRHLGGSCIFMSDRESQLGRNEPLRDTARVVSRYGDGLIVRTFGQEKLAELSRYSSVPVVNALSDAYHPCQVMSDLLTLAERIDGGVEGLGNQRVAWVGDGNNMAHSWINAAIQFPFELTLACPEGFGPDEGVLNLALEKGARVKLTHDPAEAVKDADFVNTDVWASMGQEGEQDKRARVFEGFQVNSDLLIRAAPGARVMHCLPAHRGEEITDEVMESEASIVWDQAENRLHMQKAILEWIYMERGGAQ
ncbi:ornithine carbamoyltransferase [Desulfohalovibrio reitneri]|uniref:ornithine carbamoyltransferase n=1 Tax=Desulfohalovibrio reitneri TaxID=1307759 RepID=UPI0004A7656F|nr:ornithine carbamoyltransferase [Desulfohalovibrio reitneri]